MTTLQQLLASLTIVMAGTASAQTDVTDTYLTNADFEGDHTVYSSQANDRAIYQPEGWTIEYSSSNVNDMTAIGSGDLYYTANMYGNAYTATDGNQAYRIRYRWGDSEIIRMSQTAASLPSGSYIVTADVFLTTVSATSTLSAYGQTAKIAASASKQTAGSWSTVKLTFTLTESADVTIAYELTQKNVEETVGAIDNVKLYRIDGEGGNSSDGNTTRTTGQVTDGVTLTADEDYVVNDTVPFTTTGSVDIQNTEHAVLILKHVKPSVVLSRWMDHIYIKGEPAADGVNCQIRMYDRGAIIFPYGSDARPLTCYTGNDQTGVSCDDYTEGHDGGYMKTLTGDQLNNGFRSFRLKRGYMVTFALGVGGWGYSRCFIADKSDLIVNLPAEMSARVSSYRLFQWFYAHKAGLASDGNGTHNAAVGSCWTYDWGTGNASLLPDVEWVPNHIYEDWPSSAACGSRTGSCNMKNNNEPGNKSDDHPQTVDEVLGNWQNMMRTGFRLLSETSHDSSWPHFNSFIDSIDARGWRCDVIDLHCYWATTSFFGNGYGMDRFYTRYGRPIWISEWVWGASWSGNGIFGSAPDGKNSFSLANQQKCLDGTKPILEHLNACRYVERYSYWNGEAAASRILYKDTLSLLGQYYASMDEGIGYEADIQKVPNVVTLTPKNLKGKYDYITRELTLTWTDPNGDMLDSITVQRLSDGDSDYRQIASVPLADANGKDGAGYTLTDTPPVGANTYRICIYPVGASQPKYSGLLQIVVTEAEAVWKDITDSVVTNAGFDIQSSWVTANISKGGSNHRAVEGWTTTSADGNGCAATFGIGSGLTLNGQPCPYVNAGGNTEGGALGINQGWNQSNNYTQTVTLPAGTYRMTYAVWNSSYPWRKFINQCGYSIGTNTFTYDNVTAIDTCQWTESILSPFTLKEESNVTLSVGYQSTGGTSISNPYLFFDYVKIEKSVSEDWIDPDNPTAIIGSPTARTTCPVAYYTPDGRRTTDRERGVVIVRYSDGTYGKTLR